MIRNYLEIMSENIHRFSLYSFTHKFPDKLITNRDFQLHLAEISIVASAHGQVSLV